MAKKAAVKPKEPLESLINKSWEAYKNNFISFVVAILFSGIIVTALIIAGLVPLFLIFVGAFAQGLSGSEAVIHILANWPSLLFSTLFAALFFLAACIVSCVLRGGLAAMTVEALQKKRTSYNTMFSAGRARWKSFFGVSVLVGLIAFAVIVALLLPGFITIMVGSKVVGGLMLLGGILILLPVALVMEVMFSFIYLAVFIEKAGSLAALKASARFGRKNFWDALILILFFAMLSFIVGMLNAVTYVVGSLLVYFVTVPLQLLSLAALYLGRKKGGQ